MDKHREYTNPYGREAILLQERYEKASKALLLYAVCVLLCGIFYFGWLWLYWADFFISIVILGGPWCTAMLVVNVIRCVSLKAWLRKLSRERE